MLNRSCLETKKQTKDLTIHSCTTCFPQESDPVLRLAIGVEEEAGVLRDPFGSYNDLAWGTNPGRCEAAAADPGRREAERRRRAPDWGRRRRIRESWIDQLKRLGHYVDKVKFILIGGTFMSLPADYRDYFIRNLHDALSGNTSANFEQAVCYSEHSAVKCIGLTIESRPDYCLGPHLRQMLSYGCTRVEICVQIQITYEDVARDTNRGHTVAAVADCFSLAKDAGFRDMESFRDVFGNPAFRADGLRIYPSLVIRGIGLYELWKTGRKLST
ncbi:hypothetical protein BRADI_1g68630v3 [Brachypodium distachyon]|uniref:Uncharacterized protein n=1 Tax=Brachypodium distachyon TaxID=15368 RepID=I1H7M1_BRADI|nr:hypothetical protein BRADI_1g68630v3 [Brachypodium distachyon]